MDKWKTVEEKKNMLHETPELRIMYTNVKCYHVFINNTQTKACYD